MKTQLEIPSHSFDLSLTGMPAIDLHKEGASREGSAIRLAGNRVGSSQAFDIDINTWLRPASEVYNTSSDIRDYIIVPVPVNISELPNTNGDAFSKREWLRFNHDEGRLSYQTFKGKPTFIEHNNKDHTKAMGIIFDSHLSPLRGFRGDHARLTLLMGFDRTRCPERCDRILRGELNTYSKGTTYKAYQCSICGALVTPRQRNFCEHTAFNKPAFLDPRSGKLTYRDCIGLRGFECSSVDDPAFACAASYSDHLMQIG
ncbi:putative endolysin [Erwinia phage vB_EamM_Yoloswag]|uniref:Putative endolysin n=1 Tax=Erwinia phage vB_EamM_Yoloswag TaxID=1958956 RepID=A0A1S6L360_9CAUD|nr:head maturation protease [Erwinia phage vB_EamM_Yoloswag]AQT28621.1 putative endolysin [Erwinia phage vB_EamM_Yoloswag]